MVFKKIQQYKKKALPGGRTGKAKSKKTSSDSSDKKLEQYKIEQHKKSEQKLEQLFSHLRSVIKELSTDDLVYLLYKKDYYPFQILPHPEKTFACR